MILKLIKLLIRSFQIAFILSVFTAIFLMSSIYHYSFEREDVSADAAIVLGAAVWKNAPSPVFRERINHALNLYTQGKVKYLIFTGGLSDGEKFAESKVAMNYAVKKGISDKAIFIESVSKITFENLKEAKKIMGEHQLRNVLIVSDPLHMKRSMTMANDLGLVAYTSPTPTTRYKTWKTKLEMLIRETYYFMGYYISQSIS